MGRDTNIAVQKPPEGEVIHRDHLIRVTNTHPEPITGRWNGRNFVFKTGEPIDIPIGAAEHIFGFGQDDELEKMRSFNNTGILHKCGTYEKALEYIKGIKFEEPPPLVEMTADDPRRKLPRAIRRKPATDAHPSVNGGGDEGAPGDTGAPPDPSEESGDEGVL